MIKDKGPRKDFTLTIIEIAFWLPAISVAIFINLSSQALLQTNVVFMAVLLAAFLIIILNKIYARILFPGKKSLNIILVGLITLAVFLFLKIGATGALIFYFFPTMIAVSMAILLILDPRSPIIILVALSTFLLGEGFWKIQIGADRALEFPAAFLRIFSLTLLIMFAYYLFRKEIFMRRELSLLNQRLKTLDQLKSKFVANVSHELRTPLASIENAVSLFRKKITGEKKDIGIRDEELLEIISSNIDRQSRLLDSLLDLAKIERGKVGGGATRSLVDVAGIARAVLDTMKMQIKQKNIELFVDMPKAIPKIYAAEDQILEVYTNLLDNAIKYTPENGRVSLRIRLVGNGIESVVEDTGIGISREGLDKLFDKFVRLESVLGHKEKGVGLGLVISKEIIESHSGRIWVESELGRGSKFRFWLPVGLRKSEEISALPKR